jgi:hypothetical protein
MHAAIHARGARSVSATDFEFISENAHVAAVREFLDALPAIGRA